MSTENPHPFTPATRWCPASRFAIALFILCGPLACASQERPLTFDDVYREESRIKLDSSDDYLLGPLPKIGAVASNGDCIVLDFVTTRVYVFDGKGRGKESLGAPGDGPGEYRYPLALAATRDGVFLLYDMALSRVSIYGSDYVFKTSFSPSPRLEDIEVTAEGRIFGYVNTGGARHVVHELNDQGDTLNEFAPQSGNYSIAAASRGGGIVSVGRFLYVATPYEYTVRKYTPDGDLVKTAQGRSPYYEPLRDPPDAMVLDDMRKRQEYMRSWSQFYQLLRIGDRWLGAVFADPKGSRVFMDLYDADLNQIASDLQMPDYIGGPDALFTREDRLYMLAEPADASSNPAVVTYTLRQPLDTLWKRIGDE